MPFAISNPAAVCGACINAGKQCFEDLRNAPIGNRATEFRISQQRLMDCAFDGFVPGTDSDPDPTRSFLEYRHAAANNMVAAGKVVHGAAFRLTKQQLGKVEGDVFEILEAAALWNAAAAWNQLMDTGKWTSKVFTQPPSAIPTPLRKVAIIKLPRGIDSTVLLSPGARAAYSAFDSALGSNGMELKLSTPDIIGVRMPDPMPPGYAQFLQPLPDLQFASQKRLEEAHNQIHGTLDGRDFLFAIAVKTSTRSDRLYQPLFEANVLKFIIGYVLRGPAIRFHVHMESFVGADVAGRYKAAAMTSLLLGGTPSKAVDVLYKAVKPLETAQMVLDSLPTFPI